jgi:SAM-dependent methyltransferase
MGPRRAAHFLRAKFPRLYGVYRHARTCIEDRLRDSRRTFQRIHRENRWGGAESVSGRGSDLTSTASVRNALPNLLRELEVRTLLDAACGDLNWISATDLGRIHYVGIEIVPELTERNQHIFGRGFGGSVTCEFLTRDITVDPLPRSDLILCRHCFIHLSNRRVLQALHNFQQSGARHILTTTCRGIERNEDIVTGSFRPLNLELDPFCLPPPLRLLADPAQAAPSTDFLGLWELASLKLDPSRLTS